MTAMLKTVQIQLDQKKPFVAYRKPNTYLLKMFFQRDCALVELRNFDEKGFVFCSFDGQKKFIFSRITSDHFVFPIDKNEVNEVRESNFYKNDNSESAHVKLVQQGIEAIKNNDFEKVVLSRNEVVPTRDDFDPIDTFEKMILQNPAAFVYLWYHPEVGMWLGAFGEQLLKIKNNEISTMSVAGTQKIVEGKDVNWTLKEQKEQQIVTNFIVDNLKTEVIELSFDVPKTYRSGNVAHLKSEIKGLLEPNFNLQNLIEKLHPTPAVCGFPKIKSLKFIYENEGYNREFYAGFLGELNINDDDHTKHTDLFVNLRCMKIENNTAHVYVGGGITIDHRVVQILIAHSGHGENRGRQDNLVVGGLIVGVVSLRRHLPLGSVHRLAELGNHVTELPAGRIHHVPAPGVLAHDQGRTILPAVGIADLDVESTEFLVRLRLGGIAHPIQPVDPLAVGAADDLHQIRVTPLLSFWKIFLHEDLPCQHAHGGLL